MNEGGSIGDKNNDGMVTNKNKKKYGEKENYQIDAWRGTK